MKRQEVQEVSARYTVVQRAAFEVLEKAMSLGQLDKVSKNSPELLEILEAYQNTRIKLIEASSWYRILHSCLMVRTDEGREAMLKYAEEMKKLEQKKDGSMPEPSATTEPAVAVEQSTQAEPAQAEPAVDEGHTPCLRLL